MPVLQATDVVNLARRNHQAEHSTRVNPRWRSTKAALDGKPARQRHRLRMRCCSRSRIQLLPHPVRSASMSMVAEQSLT